jgi:predicted DNA-binding protein
MSRKKISTTIYITPGQSERLKMLHARTKVPVAVYIREGIDMVLQHYEHLLPGQLSLDKSGQVSLDKSGQVSLDKSGQVSLEEKSSTSKK